MKSIKKIGKTVAASALLVGATLTGAAGMAAAQSSGSSGTTLGDYPQPFVNDDGQVDSTIVVGESAKTIDVVGAVNVAGSLGNAAFESSEKSVDVEGSFGWSASEGVTLDTRNDQLYYGDSLEEVRDTLTKDQLPSLMETSFQDEGGDETDIEYFLYPGTQSMQYGKPDDRDDEDPVHYVPNPEGVNTGDGNYLFRLQANMEDEIEFNASDVTDEEIELFGRTYTISTDTTDDELVLLGSQTELNINSGSSKTFTVDDNEHTIEVVGVTTSDEAVFRLDGTQYSKGEDQTVSVDGQEVRVSEINNFGDDSGVSDNVEFAIGSEEIRLQNGQSIEDENDDEVDGTYVVFNGDDSTSGQVDELSSIDVYIGSNDDDKEYVMAGESYSHPLFENFEFHFGGLNPDAREGGDTVNEVDVSPNGDDTLQVSYMTDGGDSANVDYAHDADVESSGGVDLADGDDETIHVVEGANVTEDTYFTSDAGDFSHIWEVTNIDRDTVGSGSNSFSSDDEATVDLKDKVTGDQVEVDLDYENENSINLYEGTEVIDGQTYKFELDSNASDPGVFVAYGDGSSVDGGNGGVSNLDVGDETTVYAAQDSQTGAVALTDNVTVSQTADTKQKYILPSTESTDDRWVEINTSTTGGQVVGTDTSSGVSLSSNDDAGTNATVSGGVTYQFKEDTGSNEVEVTVWSNGQVTDPAAVVLEPEDDNDDEEGYVVTQGYDSNDEELTVSGGAYTGDSDQRDTSQLESNDDVTAGVDFFGTYTEEDSDEQGSFTLWMPDGQAIEGAAFTAAQGSLDASASSSGTVETMTPTGWPDAAALDSDSNVGQLKNNENLILVGGPAVNNLVSELASENKTWEGSQYTEGQGIVQLVQDAFTEDNHALVVAGFSGEDTRAASNFIANYADHSDSLEGETMVEVNTAQGTVVQ